MEGEKKREKKVSLRRFGADQKIASSWKKNAFSVGHPIARAATIYCLLPDTL